jgi:hypothetical protein
MTADLCGRHASAVVPVSSGDGPPKRIMKSLTMLKFKAVLIAIIVLLANLPLCDRLHAQDNNVSIETVARVVRLLEDSGYRYPDR